jgi:hypothetical protein
MATNIQDVFMLFGDSLTQGAWEPGLDALGQKLSRESLESRSQSDSVLVLVQMSTRESWTCLTVVSPVITLIGHYRYLNR